MTEARRRGRIDRAHGVTRREFLRDGAIVAAGTAVAGPAEGQDWMPLQLFGVQFVGSARNIQKPMSSPDGVSWGPHGAHLGTYSLDGPGRCRAEVRLRVALGPTGSRTLVVCAMFAVPMIRRSNGVWWPEDGVHPQAVGTGFEVREQMSAGPPGGTVDPGAEIDLAGMYVRSDRRGISDVRVENGQVWLPFDGSVLESSGLPLRIDTGPNAALTVDLRRQVVTFAAGAFVASVHVGARRKGGERRCLRSRLEARAFEISPRREPDQKSLDLAFDPADPATRIHLHGEIGSRPGAKAQRVAAALSLSEAGLKVTLSGRKPGAVRIRGISAYGLGRSAGPAVHVPAVSSPVTGPLRFRASAPLALGIRPLLGDRPSSLLLVAAQVDGLLLDSPVPAGAGQAGLVTGLATAARFRVRASRCRLRTRHRLDLAGGGHPAVNASVLFAQTFPVLHLPAIPGGPSEIRVARSGWNYAAGAPSGAAPPEGYTFPSSQGLGFPVIPASWCRAEGEAAAWRAAAQDAGAVASGSSARLVTVSHESKRVERPRGPSVPLESVFETEGIERRPRKPRFEAYDAWEDFGFARVSVRVPSGERPSYVVFDSDAIEIRESVPLASGRSEFRLPFRAGAFDWGSAFGIVKYDGSKTVLEILGEVEGSGSFTASKCASIREALDDRTVRKDWVGLLLFDVPVDYSGFEVLKGILGGPLKLAYLACSPGSPSSGTPPSVSGLLDFVNPEAGAGQNAPGYEVSFRVDYVKARWLDSAMTSFEAKCRAEIRGLLGASAADDARLEILGGFDRRTNRIRFIGSFTKPVRLLPEDHDIPIVQQVSVERVEIGIGTNGTGAALEIEGDVSVKALPLPALKVDLEQALLRPLRFRGLRVPIPAPSAKWLPLAIDYSSLQLDLGFPSLRLGLLDLELRGFGASWKSLGLPAPSWPDFVFLGGQMPSLGDFRWVLLRIDLGNLPLLSLGKMGRLAFDVIVGGRLDGGAIALGLRGAGFDKLRIDLLRFLELEVREVRSAQVPKGAPAGEKTSCLAFEGISLRVLGTGIVENLHAYLFGSGGHGSGLVVFAPLKTDLGWLTIHWLLLGKNVELARSDAAGAGLPAGLLALEPPESSDAVEKEAAELAKAVEDGLFRPRTSPVGEWFVGAGFTVMGVLEGRVVLQDGRYYGIRLGGALLREWLGWDPAIAVDYVKGETPDQDRFSVAFAVPKVLLGAFALLGGTLALRVGMDGSFLFDAGFPWREGNVRDWRRTFGVIAGALQGAGGFYLMRDRRLGPGGQNEIVLAAGYGAEFGLGASGYSSGPFRVWARVGIYVVVEGEATLHGTKIHRLRLTGVVGVIGEASGELNWWVISVRVDIVVLAEARVVLQLTEGERAVVDADFTVYARVSAHACVGWGPFKACAGISVEIPMRFGPVRLLLG